MLNAESIWNIETDSEPELDIRFNEDIPDEDFGDKTTTITNTRKQVARKTLALRSKEL